MPARFIDVCLWGVELGILEEGIAEGATRARNLFHLDGDPLSFKDCEIVIVLTSAQFLRNRR